MMKPNQKPLNLIKALKLNSILSKYIDEKRKYKDIYDLSKDLLKKMEATPMDYLECLSLFQGVPAEKIDITDKLGVLEMFLVGLTVNRVLELRARLKILGQN